MNTAIGPRWTENRDETAMGMEPKMKYRIYKAEIGWNVACPCRSWMEKAMTFDGAVGLFQRMLKDRTC